MGGRFAVGGVIIVLLAAGTALTVVLSQIHHVFKVAFPPKSTIKAPPFLDDIAPGDPATVLALGSDRRFGDKKKGLEARSDTILVVRLDPRKHAIAVMSIPRDLKVTIPRHGVRPINAAYALGGPRLSAETVQGLGLHVSEIVNVNFGGFQRAINKLGCVYADIDRRYFNDNHPPVASAENYATIDLKPGYQLLCGSDSLDYVRFRHLDDDFVRAARQQDFLRQLKTQVGVGKLFDDREELLKIFGAYSQTTIGSRSDAEKLGFVKLVYEASKNPVTEVRFPGETHPDGSVSVAPGDLRRAIRNFEAVRGKRGSGGGATRPPKRAPRRKGLAPGLVASKREGEDHVLNLAARSRSLPVYFPAARLARGDYASGSPRSYDLKDRGGKPHRAYRIVLYAGDPGQYYGVQGTTWDKPPILDNPTDEVRMRRRTYQRYFDGRSIRLIAWRAPGAWYWVSNTLSKTLSNAQMMDIARSLQRVGQ
ncbi:MAG: polyisoprenyl-teichoic acid--peptidoglycan teichoic acid transferase [Solirubrobacteraceae bacterium]|jgi:LCP family protein required for cell wall assembly|nr:polyisoprenyl-teichoic acid--peptidoglycan teichoic acid transferase [Solirubrobacteraceae bacterium]